MTSANPSGPIRVIVVDDQDIVRDGLVTVLSLVPDLEVVGAASEGRQGVDMVAEQHPDVALMDLRMPGMSGAGATAEITRRFPQVGVLVLTTFDDDSSISEALRAGARGYLTKDASRNDIATAIRSVARGQATFDANVSAKLVSGFAASGVDPGTQRDRTPSDDCTAQNRFSGDPAAEAVSPALAELTAREREVLRLIGDGLNNSEIAEQLFVSTSTVKTHINNLFAKLGIRDRAQAVHLANRIPW
jgi:DNA-binding NarL/FixJ family response regulator